jgi:hypothetical protein
MKHKLKKTENYLLVVDESEIKVYDYITDNYKVWKWNDDSSLLGRKKVICHLPLNNLPILEGVPLLPPLEDDGDLIYENTEDSFYKKYDDALHYYSFIEGYNKAKEKYKYTEADLRKAWNAAYIDALAIDEETYKPLFFEDFIQSLQQPRYPVAFECEMGKIYGCEDPKVCLRGCHVYDNSCKHPRIDKTRPKTITNSQGQTQLVGTYIYQ